jgi:hypothetical protein
MKPKKMSWAGQVALMGEKRNAGYWWESQKERDHYKDQNVGRWILVQSILER